MRRERPLVDEVAARTVLTCESLQRLDRVADIADAETFADRVNLGHVSALDNALRCGGTFPRMIGFGAC